MENSGSYRFSFSFIEAQSNSYCDNWIEMKELNRVVLWNRVLYEVFPMSFLMEQAGGQAFTGKERVRYLDFESKLTFFPLIWNCSNYCYYRRLIWFLRRYMTVHQYSWVAMMMWRTSKHYMLKSKNNQLVNNYFYLFNFSFLILLINHICGKKKKKNTILSI